jgi:hypothetical protein
MLGGDLSLAQEIENRYKSPKDIMSLGRNDEIGMVTGNESTDASNI